MDKDEIIRIMLVALEDIADDIDSFLCPSTWKTGEHPQHDHKCEQVKKAIEEGRKLVK